MSIRQLNASYVLEEDRVLMRLTTLRNEEYRLWLTRAMVGALLQQTQVLAVKKLAQDPHVTHAPAVAKIQQQALVQGVKYAQFESAARLPLGAEPVLVKAVSANLQELAPLLMLQLTGGQNLQLQLSDDALGKIQLLMQRMNQAARWALESDIQGVPALAAPGAIHQTSKMRRGTTESPDVYEPENEEDQGKSPPERLLH
jgi:hypothetical protein